jgi:hypothetical protein
MTPEEALKELEPFMIAKNAADWSLELRLEDLRHGRD